MAERTHLFPFRTQKLSFLAPKVLVGTLTGRIGHRHFSITTRVILGPFFCALFALLRENADILRNTLSGLRFPRVMYYLVHSPSESLVLRVLLVSPRFDGRRVRSAEPNADTCGQSLSHAPHDSSLYTKEPWKKRLSCPLCVKGGSEWGDCCLGYRSSRTKRDI